MTGTVATPAIIELAGVEKTYRSGRIAFRALGGVDLAIGGEQQRVAIARAMACEPQILLGDELTGNLDTQLAQDMFRLLKKLNHGGTTVVYVTHDQALAALASRIVSVRDGLITGDTGRPA